MSSASENKLRLLRQMNAVGVPFFDCTRCLYEGTEKTRTLRESNCLWWSDDPKPGWYCASCHKELHQRPPDADSESLADVIAREYKNIADDDGKVFMLVAMLGGLVLENDEASGEMQATGELKWS